MAEPSSISVQFVGDCAARRDDNASIFAGVRIALRDCDVLGGHLETVISDRGARSPNARLAMRTEPAFARVLREIGFQVGSFAGNHALDWGYEGLDDTLRHCAAAGVALCGTGPTLAAARRPAIVEAGGMRFAFLSYCSILPEGYRAEGRRPGVAPLRAFTLYEQIEPDQPGTPARVHTRAHPQDLAAMADDIRSARDRADAVFLSIHWGIHMVEAQIADYQREVARAAVSAGATAIFGHHQHILKGVEFIDGAPIFYGLGNFAIEQPQAFDPAIVETESFRHLMSLNPDASPESLYVLPPDTRMTGIARLEFDGAKLARTYFRPAWIDDDSAPHILAPEDERFGRTAEYLRRISDAEGLSVGIENAGTMLAILPS